MVYAGNYDRKMNVITHLVIFCVVLFGFAANAEGYCLGSICKHFIECSMEVANLSLDGQSRAYSSLRYADCPGNLTEEEKIEDCRQILSNSTTQGKFVISGFQLPSYKLFWVNALNRKQFVSQSLCQGDHRDAALAKIETELENEVADCSSTKMLGTDSAPWIGLKYPSGPESYNRSKWAWQDGSPLGSFSPWNSREDAPPYCVSMCFMSSNWCLKNCVTSTRFGFCFINFTEHRFDSSSYFAAMESLLSENSSLDVVLRFEDELAETVASTGVTELHALSRPLEILVRTQRGGESEYSLHLRNTSMQYTFPQAKPFSEVRVVAFEGIFVGNSTLKLPAQSDDGLSSTLYFAFSFEPIFTGLSGYEAVSGAELGGSATFSRVVTQEQRAATMRQVFDATEEMISIKPETTVHSVEPVCVFIDPASERLSTIGCITKVEKHRVVCQCDHLTVFSILLSAKVVTLTFELKILSFVCESVSVLFLAITFVLLLYHKREINNDRTLIQINVVAALLLLHVANLLHDVALLHQISCYFFAAAVHFFLLATGMWFLLDGVRMIMAFTFPIKFRVQNASLRSKVFLIMGWSLPAFIVASALVTGLYFDNYMKPGARYINFGAFQSGIRKYDRCWQAPGTYAFILTVMLPLGIVMVVNFVAALAAAFAAAPFKGGSGRRRQEGQMENAKKTLGSICFVLLVLGSTWVIGFFTGLGNRLTSEVMLYIHTLVNGLQGVVIFFFYCLCNDTVLKRMKMCACRKQKTVKPAAQSNRGSTSKSTTL